MGLITAEQEEFRLPTCGELAGSQARTDHPCVIQDQRVPGIQELEQIPKSVVCQIARLSVQVEQTRAVPRVGRLLRDPFRW